jgi:sugar phosphate isomerase/epimerase
MNRRDFMTASGALAGTALLPAAAVARPQDGPKFRLGTVTYMVPARMDLPTLLRACKATGFEAVELRTTHAHKVEPDLPAEARKDVKKQFTDSGVTLWGYGSVCEFHAPDAAVVRKNIEDCKAFCQLARDTGARGVKVRPNSLPKGVEPARTLEQIGKALQECGKAAADQGVEIWVEVHGGGTSLPENMRAMMDHCGHPAVGVCWNSNGTDVKNGSIQSAFELLKKDIKSCHINELSSDYPWRELFRSLQGIGYDRVTLMEVGGVPEDPASKDPVANAVRFMKYYRTLWKELTRP